MKKFISYVTIVLLVLASNILKAQLEFESSEKYGQLLDVRYSPSTENVLFARTVTNHILKSTDGGQNWTVFYSVNNVNNYVKVRDLKFSDDGTHLYFNCVSQGSPLNRVEVMNVSSGEIVKTIYTPIGDDGSNLIQSYSLAKNNPQIALFHTTRFINWGLVTEVFYTQDGGQNWSSVYFSPSYGDISVNNVAISPFNNQKLYILRGPSPSGIEGGVLISDNAGQDWDEQNSGINFSAIGFHPTNENIVYVGSFLLGPNQIQQLYRTTNGGMSWLVLPIEWTDLSFNSIQDILFNPNDHQNVVVLEENEVAITKDGGNSWENYVYEVSDYEHYYYGINGSFNPFVENQMMISANYYPFISNDGGETLAKVETPFVNATGKVGFFNGENKHFYYGMRNGFVHENLQTQEETAIGFSDLGFISNQYMTGPFIDPNVEGRIFKLYETLTGTINVFLTTNHSENDQIIHSDIGIVMMGLDSFKNNPNIVLMSLGESVYKFDFTNSENIVKTGINLPEFGFVENLLFGGNENEFIIFLNGKVYKTTNNGSNWELLNNGLEILEGQIIFDGAISTFNANHWVISTSLGIFMSEDAGQTWNHSYNGQSYHKVKFSDVQEGVIMANSRYGIGGTYPASQSQILYSSNNGEEWTVISTDVLGYLSTYDMEIVFHENQTATAYFLTDDLGVVSYEVDLETMIVDDSDHLEMTLYPNPSNGIFHLKTDLKISKVEVYNLQGQKIKEMKNGNWNISELPKGIYFLKIQTEEGKIIFQKLIKA